MPARNRRGPLARFIMLVAGMGLLGVGYYWGNRYQYSGPPPPIAGVLMRPPVALPGFELQDADGLPFNLQELADRWTLIAFGDLRQAQGHLAVSRMIGVHNRLADQPERQRTLRLALAAEDQDPALARDFSRLSPALKAISGDRAELQRLRAAVGDLSTAQDSSRGDEGAPLYLIDPKARLLALFPATQEPGAIAADVAALGDRPDLLEEAAHE